MTPRLGRCPDRGCRFHLRLQRAEGGERVTPIVLLGNRSHLLQEHFMMLWNVARWMLASSPNTLG